MLKYLIKNGSLDVSKLLMTNYKKLNIDEKQLVFLIHLTKLYANSQLNLSLNAIAKQINFNLEEASIVLNELLNKGLITIKLEYTKSLKEKEVLNIDEFFTKLEKYILEEIKQELIVENEDTISKVVSICEQALNKSLTPRELEIAIDWVNQGETIENIRKALDITSKKEVTNLKYVDRILLSFKDNENVIHDEEKSKLLDEIYRNIK